MGNLDAGIHSTNGLFGGEEISNDALNRSTHSLEIARHSVITMHGGLGPTYAEVVDILRDANPRLSELELHTTAEEFTDLSMQGDYDSAWQVFHQALNEWSGE